MKILNSSGQATVEYIIVFAFLFLIAVGLVQKITLFMEGTSERIASVLSHQLSTGFCSQQCMGDGFQNSNLP